MIGLRLLAVLALVAINGFFAAAEFSLVAVRVSRVRQLVEKGVPSARVVQQLLSQLDRVVSGVQVGITLTSLGLGALGESTFAQIFRPMLDWLPGNRAAILAHSLALALAFALLTFLHVVHRRTGPQDHLARARRQGVAGHRSALLLVPAYLSLGDCRCSMAPAAAWSALWASRHTRRATPWRTPPRSCKSRSSQARERGLLAPGEERFMLGAMELGQLRVREIMVPRPDVHALPVEAGFDEVLALFATTQRSRLPVYQSSLDHVLGFVHIKDMLWVLLDRERRAEESAPRAAL